MKHIFVAISLAFLSSSSVLASLTSPNETPNGKRYGFTPKEEQMLWFLVQQYGEKNWSAVAQQMLGQTEKQCREHWMSHLAPVVNKAPWEPWEDRVILEKYNTIGGRWALIAQALGSRTDVQVKNRFQTALRQQEGFFNLKPSEV